MKGVSHFISYTLTILFGFIVVTIFSLLIYGYYDQVIKSNIRAGLEQVCLQTWGSISRLYELGQESSVTPENMSAMTIANMSLNYPENIGGKGFEVELVSASGIWSQLTNITIDEKNITIKDETTSGAKIVAKTTQTPFITYEYSVPNIPVTLQGKYRLGEDDHLKYIRYNRNGTEKNIIILGDFDIIVELINITAA